LTKGPTYTTSSGGEAKEVAMVELARRTEMAEKEAEAIAELWAVLEIGKALRPLTEEARRRVVARLLAELDREGVDSHENDRAEITRSAAVR
jgi:hypothetical protein